jgi:hypothetical protein
MRLCSSIAKARYGKRLLKGVPDGAGFHTWLVVFCYHKLADLSVRKVTG